MNKIIKLIKHPLWLVIIIDRSGLHLLSDKSYISLFYKLTFGKKLDLNHPKTYNEKIQWLKLHDRKDEYTNMVDKYEIKKIMENKIGKEYIIPTYQIYDNVKEIDFSILPNSFVIKPTHYGGNSGVVIVDDKTKINEKKIKRKLNKILKKNLYYYGREWQYKNVKPRIIVEEFLKDNNNDEMFDYKFYCFNGNVKIWFICSDRKHKVKYTFFDRKGNFIDVKQCGEPYDLNVKKPRNIDKMIELAEIISQGFIHLRVDFYEINNKIYFGETTFYDSSGFGPFEPEEWDRKIGDMIELPIDNKE